MESNQSKILCPINSLVVRDSLEVQSSFSQNLQDFMEESVIELYKHSFAKVKQVFLLKILKPNASIENQRFPLDIDLFNEESQWVLSLLCQFLGLDCDKFVPEVLLSLLFRLSLH